MQSLLVISVEFFRSRRMEMEFCEGCGLPAFIGREHRWEPNGVISLSRSPDNRMVFFESETIDGVIAGIEMLIGVPVGHIVIESRSRETRRYMERIIGREGVLREAEQEELPREERERMLSRAREISVSMMDIGRAYGYGDGRLGHTWEEGEPNPWREELYLKPYSVYFAAADLLGTVEVFEGREMWVRYEEVEGGFHRFQVFPSGHPVELRERLKRRKKHEFKPGDIEYERCAVCKVPLEVSRHQWDTQRGVILNPGTGSRMAFFGPLSLESIFDDLEVELGEVIPDMVIEAMRIYIRDTWSNEEWWRDADTFRHMIGVRGMGNLVRFEGRRNGLELTIENSALPLMMVGIVQALVEMAYRAESSQVEWSLAEDGDLDVSVRLS